jgi:hypothetical protein
MTKFLIEDGIPIPPKGGTTQYPWPEIGMGQSVFVPGDQRVVRLTRTALSAWAISNGRKFTCRVCTENGVAGIRVWRIE